MPRPKITVIIPTRERCDVLAACLRSVTSQSYDQLQIIVSDNASTDDTRAVVEASCDSRIRYLNTGQRLSMSHNWEFALSHVDDGWVTFIGDDDGLPAEAINVVADLIQKTGVMAVRSRPSAYVWPDNRGYKYGHLIVPNGHRVTIRNASVWLERVLRGHARYPQLPMIYDGGYVDMAVLHEIKKKTGSFFSSSIPDVYSAVAIASVVDRYAFTDQPLAIIGTSRHSTGTSFFSTVKGSNPRPSQLIAEEDNIPFHSDMPLMQNGTYPLSLHALVYEAFLQSTALRPSELARHAQQLSIILATSGKHRESIDAWGKQFAKLHRLDYDTAFAEAKYLRMHLSTRASLEKFIQALRSRSAGSFEAPLLNVADASVATGLLRYPPGPLSTLRRELARIRKERK